MIQILPITWVKSIITDPNNFFSGLMMAILGYLIPVKNVVHIMLFFFLLDVLFGYWAARKLRGEHFNVKIIWGHTMPRICLSLIMVLASFMLDHEYVQEYISIHRIVGFIISGVLLVSIAKNGYNITKWKVFNQIGDMVNNKIELQENQQIPKINNTNQ